MPFLLLCKSVWAVSHSVAMLIGMDDPTPGQHAWISQEYSILIWSITLEYTECEVLATDVKENSQGLHVIDFSPDVYSPK